MNESTSGVRARDVDSGWAWVILAASCLQQAIQAMTYTSGLFNIMFLEEFGKDTQTTAWIGSVQVCSLSLYGPLSSLLIQHIGSRWTVVIGGFLGFLGFLLSYFATDFVFIFFSFGFLIGLGTGISYLPWVVVVGNHFRQYRNLAYGIVSTSVGFGTMALSPLIQYLEWSYGWRGCMMIMAAIYLNIVAVGLSFRTRTRKGVTADVNLYMEGDGDDGFSERSNNVAENATVNQLSKHLTASMVSLGSRISNRAHLGSSRSSLHVTENGSARIDFRSSPMGSIPSVKNSHLREEPMENSLLKNTLVENKSAMEDHTGKSHVIDEQREHGGSKSPRAKRAMLVVLQNKSLLILAFNSFCTTGCLYLMFMHFPNSFRINGSSDSDLSVIMSVLGVSSITCRFLVGLASTSSDINAQVLYFSCGGLSGIFMLMGPYLGTTFSGQLAFAVLFGFYVNAANTLLPVVTLELCRLEDLSTAYGVQLLMCGIGSLIAPPFGGWLYDVTGDYSMTFYFAGTTYMIGSLVMMLIPLVQHRTMRGKSMTPTEGSQAA